LIKDEEEVVYALVYKWTILYNYWLIINFNKYLYLIIEWLRMSFEILSDWGSRQ